MKSAAEAGLAPHIRYSSLEDELFITEFVEEADFPAMEARKNAGCAADSACTAAVSQSFSSARVDGRRQPGGQPHENGLWMRVPNKKKRGMRRSSRIPR